MILRIYPNSPKGCHSFSKYWKFPGGIWFLFTFTCCFLKWNPWITSRCISNIRLRCRGDYNTHYNLERACEYAFLPGSWHPWELDVPRWAAWEHRAILASLSSGAGPAPGPELLQLKPILEPRGSLWDPQQLSQLPGWAGPLPSSLNPRST